MKSRSWMLWLAIVLLTVGPLVMVSTQPAPAGAEKAAFGGADERAQAAIGTLAPDYQPWFAPVLEPASAEIASLLFALQAAVGAGVIGFWLGMSVARERVRSSTVATPTSLPKAGHAD